MHADINLQLKYLLAHTLGWKTDGSFELFSSYHGSVSPKHNTHLDQVCPASDRVQPTDTRSSSFCATAPTVRASCISPNGLMTCGWQAAKSIQIQMLPEDIGPFATEMRPGIKNLLRSLTSVCCCSRMLRAHS